MGLLSAVYLAGLAAVSLPLLFHLIRRTPRGKQTFSSLMFLTPSPPRVTRRSRLDHLLLLLLRAAALCLLALAFARPFLRESALLPLADLPRRRVAILLDTSASMQRGDLWKRAVAQAGDVLDDLGPTDDVALFTFNDRLKTVVDFADSSTAPAAKLDLVRRELAELTPSWRSTDLGVALAAVANELDAPGNDEAAMAEPHLVLLSDLQQGSRTDALQAFSWPQRVPVVVHALAIEQPTNASVHLLADEAELETTEPRVRVANASDSVGEEFYVHWTTSDKSAIDDTMVPIYVPPGQSRVVRLPRPKSAPMADRIVLRGDAAEFDNVHYVVAPRQQEIAIAYLGAEPADDPQGPRYYFERAIAGMPLRKVDLRASRVGDPLSLAGEKAPKLTVLAEAVPQPMREAVERYLSSGGMLLVVLKDRPMAESLAFLFEGLEVGDETESGEYQLLGEIDFTHPLFAPFASPRYSDFTKIHFWKRRSLTIRPGAGTRVIARFDNHEPAIIERTIGAGRALLFASGWQPSDSLRQAGLPRQRHGRTDDLFTAAIKIAADRCCHSTGRERRTRCND
jgi:hypothetical protein